MSIYKLKHFNLSERDEILRLIFAVSGKKYSNDRIEFEQWSDQKNQAPLEKLPYLKIDSVRLPQSMAIARFVARETGLIGKNSLEQAQVDAIVETIMEPVNYFYAYVYSIDDPDEKNEAFEDFFEKQGTKGAKNVEKLIEMYGSNGYSVGDSLTLADLAIFDAVNSILIQHPKFSQSFPVLNKIFENVKANSDVVNYVKNH